MNDASPFYPPRARWSSPLRYRCQRLEDLLEKVRCPLSVSYIVGSLLIPGFSFFAYKPFVGNVAIASYWLCVIGFFVWFGYPAGNWMFAAILAIHACSIAFLIKRFGPEFSLKFKIFSIVVLLFALNFCLYMPARNWISHYFIPARMGDRVIVTRRSSPKNINRGDWILYEIDAAQNHYGEHFHNGVYLESGFGFSPVLAASGDTVRFEPGKFWVNDRGFPNQPFMPTNGTVVVQEKQWFVWPTLGITGNSVPTAQITQILQAQSIVNEKTFIGQPCKRWLWRKQLQP